MTAPARDPRWRSWLPWLAVAATVLLGAAVLHSLPSMPDCQKDPPFYLAGTAADCAARPTYSDSNNKRTDYGSK